MAVTTVLDAGPITVVDYRCEAKPGDVPFVEWHSAFTISYVRTGSFGYRFRGNSFELVAGSLLVGHPGDEYVCTHDHVGGEARRHGLPGRLGAAHGDRADRRRRSHRAAGPA